MIKTSSRTPYLLLAVVSLAMIAAALYLQHVEMMAPCPLCVIQRYAFLGIAVFALAAASRNPSVRTGGTVLALASALAGGAVAVRHLWLLAHPGVSCGIDPLETSLNRIFTADLLPSVFKADGLCTTVHTLFGLSIPTWSLAGFFLLAVALAYLLVKRLRG